MSDRVEMLTVPALTPFSVLFDGAEVKNWGSAVKDGDYYLAGQRQGRVLSIEHHPAGIYVSYLKATKR